MSKLESSVKLNLGEDKEEEEEEDEEEEEEYESDSEEIDQKNINFAPDIKKDNENKQLGSNKDNKKLNKEENEEDEESDEEEEEDEENEEENAEDEEEEEEDEENEEVINTKDIKDNNESKDENDYKESKDNKNIQNNSKDLCNKVITKNNEIDLDSNNNQINFNNNINADIEPYENNNGLKTPYEIENNNSIKNKFKNNEKSVFTKLSEDIFSKSIGNKRGNFSSYNLMINDNYLNKLSEKQKNKNIPASKLISNIIDRNNEYSKKRELKLKAIKDKKQEVIDKNIYSIPGNKTIIKENIRSFDEFYKSIKQFQDDKQNNINSIKKNNEKEALIPLQKIPIINENSRKIANEKLTKDRIEKEAKIRQEIERKKQLSTANENFDELENQLLLNAKKETIVDRLTSTKTAKKERKHVSKLKKKEIDNNEFIKKKLNQKKSINEINEISNKLYKESEYIKTKRNEETRKLMSTYFVPSTNKFNSVLILKNFIKEWLNVLSSKLISIKNEDLKNDDIKSEVNNLENKDIEEHQALSKINLNFNQFMDMLYFTGFILYEHQPKEIEVFINNVINNIDIDNKIKQSKSKLLKINNNKKIIDENENTNIHCNDASLIVPNKELDNDGELVEEDINLIRQRKKKISELKTCFSLFKHIYINLNECSEKDVLIQLDTKINNLNIFIYLSCIIGAYYVKEENIHKSTSKEAKNKKKPKLIKNNKIDYNKKTAEKVKKKQDNKFISSMVSDLEIKDPLKNVIGPNFNIKNPEEYSVNKNLAKSTEIKFNILGYNFIQSFMNKKKKNIEDLEQIHKSNHKSSQINYNEESRNIYALNYRQRCYDIVRDELETTFKLDKNTIDKELNLSYANQSKSKVRLEDIYQILKQKKINQHRILNENKNKEEISKYSFHPNINKKSRMYNKLKNTNKIADNNNDNINELNNRNNNIKPNNTLSQTLNNLYEDSKQRNLVLTEKLNNKKKNEEESLSRMLSYKIELSSIDRSMFENNPLKDDKSVISEMQRFERARLDKKIAQLQKEKGITLLKNYDNIEEILNYDSNIYPSWSFSINKKSNKDTFENYNNSRFKTINNNYSNVNLDYINPDNIEDYNNIQNEENEINNDNNNNNEIDLVNDLENQNNQHNNENVILRLDVNIDDNNRLEKLEIHANEDINKVIDNFCVKFQIPDVKKDRLIRIVEERLASINEYNIN